MQIWNYLSPLDLFRQPLLLRVDRREMTSTRFGIFLSLLIYGSLSYFFSQSDFFLKQKPKIVMETSALSYSPVLIYSKRAFAFAVKDLFGNVAYDPSYFSFIVESIASYPKEINGSTQVIVDINQRSFHKCMQSDASSMEEFLLLNNSFCLDQNSFKVSGANGEINSDTFQIHIYLCQNSSLNGNFCKSTDQISEFFTLKNLNLLYVNTLFQPNTYETATTTKYVSEVHKLEPKLSRLVTIHIQKAVIKTDETVLLPNTKTEETFTFESETVEIGLAGVNTPVTSILFFSSNNLLTLTRSYQSLPEAAAVLGGLFSFSLMCGKILSQIDKAIHLTTLLMNLLYTFQEPKKKTFMKQNTFVKRTLSELKFMEEDPKSSEIPGHWVKPQRKPFISMEHQQKKIGNLLNPNDLAEKPKDLVYAIEISTKLTPPKDAEYKNLMESPNILQITPQIPRNFENQKLSPRVEIQKIPEKILQDDSLHREKIINKYHHKNEEKKIIGNHERVKTEGVRFEISKNPLIEVESPPLATPGAGTGRSSPWRRMSKYLNFRNIFQVEGKEEHRTLEEFLNFTEENHKIKFNFFDFLRLIAKKIMRAKTTFVEKLFMRAQEVFEDEIDIVKILRRIQDIDKLKYLLLTEKQIALFNMLERPMIFVDEEAHLDDSSVAFAHKRASAVSSKDEIRQAFNYYLEIEKKKELDPVDKKLFFLVDKKFRTYKKYFKRE